MTRQDGFTLIELVMVIVVIAVASIPLFGLFSQATTSLLDNESLQTGTQLAQERAELVLALRRSQGFNGPAAELAVGTITENLAAPYSGYVRTTTVTQPLVAPTGCPAGATCKDVAISVTRSGQTLAQLSYLLVNY